MRFFSNGTNAEHHNGNAAPTTQSPTTMANHLSGLSETCNRIRTLTIASVGAGKVFNNVIAPVEPVAAIDDDGSGSSQSSGSTNTTPTKVRTDGAQTVQVQPMLVRKTPKFPSRERHLAIRRKKNIPKTAPLPWTLPVNKNNNNTGNRGNRNDVNGNTNASTCCCTDINDHVHVESSVFQTNASVASPTTFVANGEYFNEVVVDDIATDLCEHSCQK